ncbi:MAG: hypothetical protein KF857_12640 [Fimbriimonadaceae bacterium]|nr:hypothetical protein [Fimbriimonadaceae bacterium]
MIRDQSPFDPVKENRRSIGVAAGLALLTLATFASAAGRGPESAIKKFHEAVKENDVAALAQVTLQPPDDPDVQRLAGVVRQLLSIEPHVELGKVQSIRTDAVVDVTYNRGRFGRQTVRFVLSQKKQVWQVDARETLDLYRRPFGL